MDRGCAGIQRAVLEHENGQCTRAVRVQQGRCAVVQAGGAGVAARAIRIRMLVVAPSRRDLKALRVRVPKSVYVT